MSLTLRDFAFRADDIAKEAVEVPEWSSEGIVPVFEVRTITEDERIAIMNLVGDDEDDSYGVGDVALLHTIAAVFDPATGEKVFEESDYEMLKSKSARAISRLGNVAMRLSRFDEEDDEAPKDSSSTTPKSDTDS